MLPFQDRPARQQRGVALITVLLIVALLSASAGRLGFSNQVWLVQTENGAAWLQSRQANRAVQDWAGLILEKDNNSYDGAGDLWATSLPPVPVGPGFVQGYINDLQGRFNLNNLLDGNGRKVDEAALAQFQRLLRLLALDPAIAEAAADWVDADGQTRGAGGAEDGYYLGLNPPYLAANRPFTDAAELRLIRGLDRGAWLKLNPHVTALPKEGEKTRININTASPEVLAAALPGWGKPGVALGKARQLSEATRQAPCRKLENCRAAALLPPGRRTTRKELTVSSSFFLAHTRIDMGRSQSRMETVYRRRGNNAHVLSHRRVLE